jgi:hypothetical protein
LAPRYLNCKLEQTGRVRPNSRRIHVRYRICAIAVVNGSSWSWYFVGTHEQYNSFIGK